MAKVTKPSGGRAVQVPFVARCPAFADPVETGSMTSNSAPGSTAPGLFDLDPKNKRAKRPDGFYGYRASGTFSSPSFTPNPGSAAKEKGGKSAEE